MIILQHEWHFFWRYLFLLISYTFHCRKATFINNDLSEDRTENSQLSDSPAEGNSSGNEDLSEFEVSEYDGE